MTDAGCAARLDLVEMAEQVESGPAATVVQFGVGQHTEESALSNIRIAQDSQAQVYELRTRGKTLYKEQEKRH